MCAFLLKIDTNDIKKEYLSSLKLNTTLCDDLQYDSKKNYKHCIPNLTLQQELTPLHCSNDTSIDLFLSQLHFE